MARGFAAGLFVAFSPLLGLHTAMAFGLAFLVRGNRLASLAASWGCNPLTMIPILLLDYRFGCLLLHCDAGIPQHLESLEHVLRLGAQVAVPLLVGGHLLGLLVALASYPVVRMTILFLRRGKNGAAGDGPAAMPADAGAAAPVGAATTDKTSPPAPESAADDAAGEG
jgi:hypothetical protein